MKIFELFEQTIAPTPPGQAPTPLPAGTSQPALVNTATATTQAGTTPINPPTMGQSPEQQQQQQQMQQITQQSKTNLTDLDKIAAQIVGLKQKQQQMQQQLQQTTGI